MEKQLSYQELSKLVYERILKDFPNKDITKIDLGLHFYGVSLKEKLFDELRFDHDSVWPYSETLESILHDFRSSGIIYNKTYIQ